MRKTSMILCLILTAAIANAAAEKRVHKTASMNPNGSVSIDTHNGTIVVNTWNQATVDVTARIELAVTIGLLVIFLTMYTTVIERTRDIGVLKSLGANHWFVIRALLSESAALCLLGIGAGVGLSYLVRAGFIWKFPTLTILITSGWVLRAAGIALVGALCGASYPAWLASRKDPVQALSYD